MSWMQTRDKTCKNNTNFKMKSCTKVTINMKKIINWIMIEWMIDIISMQWIITSHSKTQQVMLKTDFEVRESFLLH
jgi:hypothetical protein